MQVYTRIRHVERVIGRGMRGGRILMGPYNVKREGPVMLIGGSAALSLLLAGAAAGLRLLLLAVIVAGLILMATATAVGYVRGMSTWPPMSVKMHAKRNQWRRGPVYVDSHNATPPESIVAGGSIGVSR
ncbi:hypothetical protein [Mycolicibacterium fortuitum]